MCSCCSFGGFLVRTIGQSELNTDVTTRELHLIHSEKGFTRRIMHYHYHTWPDHGVPESTAPIRMLSRVVRNTKLDGPPIVHCSAGENSSSLATPMTDLHSCSPLDQDRALQLKSWHIACILLVMHSTDYTLSANISKA